MSPELSKHYTPSELESKWYEYWRRNGQFTADPDADGEPYCIVIPPPNITGRLHMGHALNNSLQDILIRWKRMAGRNTLWVPGTDHAGIATQNRVEKELRGQGLDRRAMGREAFEQRVWQWREEYGDIILQQLKQMGCSCDWTRTRFTLDDGLSRAVRTVFKRLYDEGLIYKGSYLVNWCPKDQTALSDDEVEYQEVQGHLWHIRYPLEDGSGHIIVATTRPETVLGDSGVAFNPKDSRYDHLKGKRCTLPLLNRAMPFIQDEHVDPEFGTGLVKVTPAHDPNDYEMGMKHGLELINILNPDGTINENGGPYEGLDRFEARKRIVKDLEDQGLIEKVEDHTHQVGHSYRSHAPVEPYISTQWFVSMKPLAEEAIKAVEDGRTRFIPKSWENTYFHWMRNVRDWCISRQLWWGHQIPAWYCEDCGHTTVSDEEEIEKCEKCGSGDVRQEEDVLDTWFSSALWPFSTLGWPDETKDLKTYYPTSALLTAHEIIFFWVARMIMMGLKFMGEVPFSDVYIHPMVFDEHTKKKMSKSLGNIIDPLEMIEKYGVDAMRMTVSAYAVKGSNLYLSEERFEGYQNFMNKFWNSARFVLMNTEDLSVEDIRKGLDAEALELEDRWMLGSFRKLIERCDASLGAYEFDQYVHHLYHFVWGQYCDWYVEFVKRRLYSDDPAKAPGRKNAQIILVTVLEGLCRVMHPATPFITEEIRQRLREGREALGAGEGMGLGDAFASESIMRAPWPCVDSYPAAEERELRQMELLMDAIGEIRRIRSQMTVPPSQTLEAKFISQSAEELAFLESQSHHIRDLARMGDLQFEEKSTDEAVGQEEEGVSATAVVGPVVISVQLPPEMIEAERERLSRELEKLEKGLEKSKKKLENPQFVEKAPEKVVQAERDRKDEAEAQCAELRAQLKRLGAPQAS